jgi:hypothetical protein
MATWQSRLEKLVRLSDSLPEPLNDIFSASRPLDSTWPNELPSCPALQKLYQICDGGRFGGGLDVYEFLPRARLLPETERLGGELRDHYEGGESLSDRMLVLAFDDVGGLCWDAVRDKLYQFDLGGCSVSEPFPDLSFEAFLERLFSPDQAEGELAAYWAEALRWLDDHN